MANGHYVLQAHRFAESDFDHLKFLLEWANIPINSKVIDMGSGTGAMAHMWHSLRPDIDFTLVNISQMQLDSIPKFCVQHCCDMERVPEKSGKFDVAVCCFSVGHTDIKSAVQEMKRLVKSGGLIFIYDMLRDSGDNNRMLELGYQVFDVSFWDNLASDLGISLIKHEIPNSVGSFGESLFGDSYNHYFGDVSPSLWLWRA